MTQVDLGVFLVAGVVGAYTHPLSSRVAWGIVGVYALLRLLHVV